MLSQGAHKTSHMTHGCCASAKVQLFWPGRNDPLNQVVHFHDIDMCLPQEYPTACCKSTPQFIHTWELGQLCTAALQHSSTVVLLYCVTVLLCHCEQQLHKRNSHYSKVSMLHSPHRRAGKNTLGTCHAVASSQHADVSQSFFTLTSSNMRSAASLPRLSSLRMFASFSAKGRQPKAPLR